MSTSDRSFLFVCSRPSGWAVAPLVWKSRAPHRRIFGCVAFGISLT